MKDYMILSGNLKMFNDELTNQVIEAMKIGWNPIGGVCITDGYAFQAMIRESHSMRSNSKKKKSKS